MRKSLLVLSGGLDSTVSSWIAKKETTPILALTFDYEQRAVQREIEAAAAVASDLNVPHKVLPLPWLGEITSNPLTQRKMAFPRLREEELDQVPKTLETARAVWVPNRNGVFLNIAASFAESLGADLIVTGFNAEEGVSFPDNSPPFIRAADEFFWYSTQTKVRVASFVQGMSKLDIAKKGRELGIDFGKLWSCYDGEKKPCRVCESCLRSLRAFRKAGIHEN